jgi:hypothetical protein
LAACHAPSCQPDFVSALSACWREPGSRARICPDFCRFFRKKGKSQGKFLYFAPISQSLLPEVSEKEALDHKWEALTSRGRIIRIVVNDG